MKKIIIILVIFIALLGTLLLFKIASTPSSELPVEETLSASKDGVSQFTYTDLTLDRLTYGMTRSDVVRLLGEPDKQEDSLESPDKTFIYNRSITYYYGDDLVLVFYDFERGEMLLGNVMTTNSQYTFTRNLKVGSTKDDVLNAFYHETRLKSYSQDGKEIGKFLYGNTHQDQLFDTEITDSFGYGFINTYASTDTKTILEYVYYQAPFASKFATSNDAHAQLVFTIEHDVVTSIAWEYFPLQKEDDSALTE